MDKIVNGLATLALRELVSWFIPHAVSPYPKSQKSAVKL